MAQLGAGVISALFLAYGVAGFIGNLLGGWLVAGGWWLVAGDAQRAPGVDLVGLVIGLSTAGRQAGGGALKIGSLPAPG